MKIPADVLPLHRPERNATSADTRVAQPVGESARLASTLPKSVPNPLPTPPADRAKERRRLADQDADGERGQQGDRRKARQQVLIDTRAARGRRNGDGSTMIDVTV